MVISRFLFLFLYLGFGFSIFFRAIFETFNKLFGNFKILETLSDIFFIMTVWLIIGDLIISYFIIYYPLLSKFYYILLLAISFFSFVFSKVKEVKFISGIIGAVTGGVLALSFVQTINPFVSSIGGSIFGFISGNIIGNDFKRDKENINAPSEIGAISTGLIQGGCTTFFTNFILQRYDFFSLFNDLLKSIIYFSIIGLILIIPSILIGMIAYKVGVLLEAIVDLVSKILSFFLKIIIILISQRPTICKECLTYNSPFDSKYENGRKCKHCGAELKKVKYNWLKENVMKFIDGLKYFNEEEKIKGCAWALDKIKDKKVNPIYNFKSSYPNLICKDCFLRTDLKIIKISNFKNFSYPVCRHCGSPLSLQPKIEKVIGVIGGDINDFNIIGELLYVNLIKGEDVRNADIDEIEIREGIYNKSYDYVINKVYTTLYNDVSRDTAFFKGIRVVIKGKSNISEDVKKMLKEKFKEVVYI